MQRNTTRRWHLPLGLRLLVAAGILALAHKKGPLTMNVPDFQKANSLKISYMADDETKKFEVRDGAARDILASIEVTGQLANDPIGLLPVGRVVFRTPGGKSVNAFFVGPEQLDIEGGVAIFLKRAFYEKVCAAASANAGRPIDVLQRN
jgi:hypothetical protein